MVHTISHNLSSNTALDTLKFAAFQRQLLLFFTGIDYAARWNKSHPDEDCQVTEVIARSLLEKAKVLSRVGSGEERDRMNGMAGLAEGIMYEWPPAAGWVSTSFDGSYGPIWSPQPFLLDFQFECECVPTEFLTLDGITHQGILFRDLLHQLPTSLVTLLISIISLQL